jgi:hypothetical protein
MKEDQKLKFWLDVSIRKRIRNSKVTIKLYSFVSSKGTDDVMKIYDTKRRCGWEGGLSVFELQLQKRKESKGWMWWRGMPGVRAEKHSNQWNLSIVPYFLFPKFKRIYAVILTIPNGKWNSVNWTNVRLSFLNTWRYFVIVDNSSY